MDYDHRIETTFRTHEVDDDQSQRMDTIRKACRALAVCIDHHCPDGRDKTKALSFLEEAMFAANASIAREKEPI